MSYSARLYAGPDVWGRTYTPEPVAHCADWQEHRRQERIKTMMRQVRNLRRAA